MGSLKKRMTQKWKFFLSLARSESFFLPFLLHPTTTLALSLFFSFFMRQAAASAYFIHKSSFEWDFSSL